MAKEHVNIRIYSEIEIFISPSFKHCLEIQMFDYFKILNVYKTLNVYEIVWLF